MHPVDETCAFWTKRKQVALRRDLYLRVLSDSHSADATAKLLRPANSPVFDGAYQKQRVKWEAHLVKRELEAFHELISSRDLSDDE